jgi:hypothetical protein
MPVVNQAVKLIYGTRPAVTSWPATEAQVEAIFVDKLMHEGVAGWERAWHPLDMTVRPMIEFNHFNITWTMPTQSPGGIAPIPNTGTLAGQSISCGYSVKGLPLGGRKTPGMGYSTRLYASPGLAVWPAGGSLTTFAFANCPSGGDAGLWSNDFYYVMPPFLGADGMPVHLDNPEQQYTIQRGCGMMWKDTVYGTGAYANGPSGTPMFRGNPANPMPNGWGSQYWELGAANFYRRNGGDLTSTITGSKVGAFAGYTVPTASGIGTSICLSAVQDQHLCGSSSEVGYSAYTAIWYGPAPPKAEIEKLEGWCHWQYGYQSLLDAAHPYKNAPPQA